MGWTNRAHDPLQRLTLDLCCLYHHFVRLVDISVDTRNPRHPLGEYRSELPEFPRCARSESSPRQERPRVETVLGVRRVDQE